MTMRPPTMSRRRATAAFAALLVSAGVLAGCGGGSGISTLGTGGPAGSLSSIPDTAAYRSSIAVNDLQSLYKSAGVSFPPPVAHLNAGAEGMAWRQVGDGSQLGSELLSNTEPGTELLGYDPLAISSEVSAGGPPDQLSLVQGTIDPSQVGAAMSKLGVRPVSTGAVVRYTVNNPIALPGDAAPGVFLGVRNLEVLGRGGRAAAGGPTVPPGDVTSLLRGSHTSRSLASDPEVQQALGYLKGADVIQLGTSFVASPAQMLGPDAPAFAERQLRQKLGLDRLLAAPTFVGYGYLPGDPTNAAAVAVAIYPDAKDAKAAASVAASTFRSGISPRTSEPYAQLFTVGAVTAHGDAVVARLTDRKGGAIPQEVLQRDFPLFWSP